jgi:curved DNA-binding protein CbpA
MVHAFYTVAIAKLNAPSELDLYAVLDLAPDATDEAIRRQYKRLAKTFHPDLNAHPDATGRMKSLNEAYRVLGDADRRAAYDSLASLFQWGAQAANTNRQRGGREVERFDGDLDDEMSISEMLSRKRAAQQLVVRKSDYRLYYVSSLDHQSWYRVSVDTGCHCPDASGLAGPFGCKHWFAMEAFRNNGDAPTQPRAAKARTAASA